MMEVGNSDALFHLVVENGELLKQKQTMASEVDHLRARADAAKKEAAEITAELQKEGVHVTVGSAD
jgi:hypothetical protein